MPATVVIRRWTGASGSPTQTNITSANTVANAVDSHQATASSSTNPIRIPTAGTNYSYWVATRLQCTVAPAGGISNIRWHTDGTNNFGTGVGCNVGQAGTYVQATGTAGTTGNILNNTNYSGVGTPSNAFAYKSTATFAITGSIGATTGDFGNFVVYQLTVGTTANPGTTSQETFTWLYDET